MSLINNRDYIGMDLIFNPSKLRINLWFLKWILDELWWKIKIWKFIRIWDGCRFYIAKTKKKKKVYKK